MHTYYVLLPTRETEGPITKDELAARIHDGRLRRDDLVCRVGEQEWVGAGTLAELASDFDFADRRQAAGGSGMPPGGGGAEGDGGFGGDPAGGSPFRMRGPAQFDSPTPVVLPPFTVGSALSGGFALLKAHYGLLLGCTFLIIGISFVQQAPALVVGFSSPGMTTPTLPLGAYLWIYGIGLATLPLMFGVPLIAARLARGEDAGFGDIIQPYRRLGRLIVLFLMYILAAIAVGGAFTAVAFLTLGAGLASGSSGAGTAIFLVVAIVLGAVCWLLLLRVMPTPLLLVDPAYDLSAGDAVAHSWRQTRGHVLRMLGGVILLALIVMLSMLACYLPALFFGLPFMYAVYGMAYAQLFRGPEADGLTSNTLGVETTAFNA